MIWLKAFGVSAGFFLVIIAFGLSMYGPMWLAGVWTLALLGVTTFVTKKLLE